MAKSLGERTKDFFVGREARTIERPGEITTGGPVSIQDRQNFYQALQEALGVGRGIAGQQQTLADMLAARARGEGTSVAELQLQRAAEENARRAAGALAGVRGMNPALARRLLLQQQSRIAQETAGQGALLRAQEQQAAQQALGTQLAGMRQAEQALYGQSGELGLGQEKLGTSLQESAEERRLKAQEATQRGQLEAERLQIEEDKAAAQDKGLIGEIGEGVVEAGKAFAKAKGGGFDGGSVNDDGSIGMAAGGMTKAAITKAHNAAKKALKAGEFKQYGDRAESVAYATMTKLAKQKKLADGGLSALDNEKNDIIPAMLSPGEMVIPRSVMASTNSPIRAAAFVKAIQDSMSPQEARKKALGGSVMEKLAELKARKEKLAK